MEFKFKDAEVVEAVLTRVALFLKANNVVVFRGFVVFPSFLFMQQQFQLFCMLRMYMVNALVKLRNFQ